jgi:uncharacterized protein (DUF1684 family)
MVIRVVEDYEAEQHAFRSKRDAALRAEDGWLTATNVSLLVEGMNLVSFGHIAVKGDSVRVTIHEGREVTCRGERVRERKVDPDQDGDVLREGTVWHQVVRRGDTLAVRTHDAAHEARRTFAGPEWFPIDRSWRLSARAVPLERPRDHVLRYSIDASETVTTDYVLVVERDGVTYSIEPIVEPKRLFIQFRDPTNGAETSHVGRYLYAALPQQGRTVLDFNRALSPGCAYNEHVISPLPPARNAVHVKIEAGEKAPKRT